MRFRLAVTAAALLTLVALLPVRHAQAAAEVHRFSVMLSGIPTQVQGGSYNDFIDHYNLVILAPKGYEELDHIAFTWGYDAELRYFVRPNFAISAGVSQIKVTLAKEYLPAISQAVDLRGEVITTPIHIGGAYYLQPYNQGDFQARAFFGAGLEQYTRSRATFEQILVNPDTALASAWTDRSHMDWGESYKLQLTQDAPGYYLEAGGHMFFASRFSVLISGMYRSGVLRDTRIDGLVSRGNQVIVPTPGGVWTDPKGKPYRLDVSGLAVRFALGFGF